MGFDIKKEKDAAKVEDAGTVVHIEGLDGSLMYYQDANGEEKPITITVAGMHSTTYRRVEERQRQRKLRARSVTAEAIHEDAVERVVACTLAWEGFYDGEEVADFNRKKVKELYTLCPWVYDQVVEAMSDHSRFFGKESNS